MSIPIIYVSSVPELQLVSVAYASFNKATTADANTCKIPIESKIWPQYGTS